MLLTASPLGRAMRAVADNPALPLRGVERRSPRASPAERRAQGRRGARRARSRHRPDGLELPDPDFAAAILGGLGSPLGAVAGALMIGIAEEMSALVLPTTTAAVSFTVILLLLLFRTNGLFGAKAVRK